MEKFFSLSKKLISINKYLSTDIQLLEFDVLQIQLNNDQPNILLIDDSTSNDDYKSLEKISKQYPLTRIICINDGIDNAKLYSLLLQGINNLSSEIFASLAAKEFTDWVLHDENKILIIDDRIVDGLNYEKLMLNTGFQVKTIRSNVEIIEPIKFYQPDLLLVVIDLNEIAGEELVRLIKNVPDNLSLPIFFISNESPNELKRKILDVGATEILSKPMKNEDIVLKIVRQIQTNKLHLVYSQLKPIQSKQAYIPIVDKDHDEIISFITDNSQNKSASVIWLKINNKAILQKKIGLSGFKYLCENFIENLPNSHINFSETYQTSEGIFAFTSNSLTRELSIKWVEEIQVWVLNTQFKSRNKNFNVIIKPFILTDIPTKSNKELLFYDVERLLLNSGTSQDIIYISEGNDQKHFYLIKTKLENAIRDKNFNWLYQSILSTKNDQLEIFQLLLRVIDKNGKELITKDYLDVANQTGLLKLLDRFTLEHAVNIIKMGETEEKERHILVNQLISDYESEEYKSNIIEYIKSQNLPKNRLVFQFRQDMVEDYTGLLNELGNELRQLNITICLSEFDSSETAWNIAKALKVHWIRVKPFDIKSNYLHKNNPEYIGNIINKAQSLGYKLMIPNVDSAGLTADIWTLNADFIQGNFIQAPVTDLKYIEG